MSRCLSAHACLVSRPGDCSYTARFNTSAAHTTNKRTGKFVSAHQNRCRIFLTHRTYTRKLNTHIRTNAVFSQAENNGGKLMPEICKGDDDVSGVWTKKQNTREKVCCAEVFPTHNGCATEKKILKRRKLAKISVLCARFVQFRCASSATSVNCAISLFGKAFIVTGAHHRIIAVWCGPNK